MQIKPFAAMTLVAVSLIGCANPQAPDQKSAKPTQAPVSVVSKDSKFAKLSLGMTTKAVYDAIGMPDDSDSHESGKRWIPFYFGNDARRLEALYKNEGCLVFASGNIWGANAEGELKEIKVDPSGACFSH